MAIHEAPFQVSTTGRLTWPVGPYHPTAVLAVGEVHDTPCSPSMTVAPAGIAGATLVHVEPFQTASISVGPANPVAGPPPDTAIQNVVLVHDTESRTSALQVFGATDQAEPFHISINGSSVVPLE